MVCKRNTIYVGSDAREKIRFQYGTWLHMAVVKVVDISGNTKALPDNLYKNHTPSQCIHTGLRARMSNQSSLETSCLKLFCYCTIRISGVSGAVCPTLRTSIL